MLARNLTATSIMRQAWMKSEGAISNAEQARALQNSSNLEMSKLPKGSLEFLKKVGEMKILAENVKKLETLAKDADAKFQEVFLSIPNMPHESVPDGKGEDENHVISTYGFT